MKIFKKRETAIQNMTFISIMSAINCVILLLTSFQPPLRLLLTLSLPFASLVVTITCKKTYYPFYMLVTIGLCLLVSLDSISSVIFYILPSLLSGFIFGFCLEKEIPSSYSILYSGFTYVICSYINLIICEFLIGQRVQDVYFTLFNLTTFRYKEDIVSLFIFAIGIIQSSLSYLFIENAVSRLGYKEKEIDDTNFYIYAIVFTLLSVIAIFLKPETYLMFIGFAVYSFIQADFSLLRNKPKLFAVANVVGLISIFFSFGLLFNVLEPRFTLAIVLIPLFIVVIIGFINNCFVKREH